MSQRIAANRIATMPSMAKVTVVPQWGADYRAQRIPAILSAINQGFCSSEMRLASKSYVERADELRDRLFSLKK